jgi:cytochrome c peroxidase
MAYDAEHMPCSYSPGPVACSHNFLHKASYVIFSRGKQGRIARICIRRLDFMLCAAVLLPAMLAAAEAAGAPGSPFYADSFATHPSTETLTSLGRALFFDRSLSASGQLACSSCHDPRNAFGPPNALAVQRGGRDGREFGVRAVPSLMYAQNTPPFTQHFVDDDGDDSVDQGPAGGRTWDGRAQSAHEQAVLPLLSPLEMANVDARSVVTRLQHGTRAAQFRATFGAQVFASQDLAFKGLLLALETYQQSAAEFYPYTSKYDAWLRHETALSAEELRGLDIFNDPTKGNCARCHPSGMRRGALPQFTDFGFAAIGVPRNRQIPANRDRAYYDLGLCGPQREDLRDRPEYCGMFRTPTLRNVAKRRVFFHNGAMHRLFDAVQFYAQRDLLPAKWYPPAGGGALRPYDDLPAPFVGNLDSQGPFDRHAGDTPAMTDADVRSVVAFLQTLSDGYHAP